MKALAIVYFCVFFSWAAYATETENQPDKALTPTTSHIEKLRPPTLDAKQFCTADQQWCLSLNGKVGADGKITTHAFVVRTSRTTQTYYLPDDAQSPAAQPDPAQSDAESNNVTFESWDRMQIDLWPTRIVSASGNVLVGLLSSQTTMYSGGGGGAAYLELFRLDASGKAESVLSVPWHSWKMIRACFTAWDYRQRRGDCHDEYQYTARLSLLGQDDAGLPVLRYQSVATNFPGNISRRTDSTTVQGQLRTKDLKTADPTCSGTREMRYSPKIQAYAPDRPLSAECTADYFDL